MSIETEILAASFWENWNYAKELHRMKHPKANAQWKAAQGIRAELNVEQLKQKANNEESLLSHSSGSDST